MADKKTKEKLEEMGKYLGRFEKYLLMVEKKVSELSRRLQAAEAANGIGIKEELTKEIEAIKRSIKQNQELARENYADSRKHDNTIEHLQNKIIPNFEERIYGLEKASNLRAETLAKQLKTLEKELNGIIDEIATGRILAPDEMVRALERALEIIKLNGEEKND